ncbi:PAS domain S-box protein [Mucilaginibacter daejeonensis]|uniref:PAS domain-containing protein n=1 Tax=Mucilaginibacter daejeonensis TaxID=398049 RepID=UPI001D17A982|nr:PAS domain S-box protein [Mucilaginibacter daejeonensis]UEG53242.1 PAS domain S-box protein [Mucilaginibacter daejeonensis]
MAAHFADRIDIEKLIDKGHTGIILLDARLRPIYISPAAQRMTGLTADAAAELSIADHVHPADRPHLDLFWPGFVSTPGHSSPKRVRFRTLTGSYVCFQCTFTNMLHENDVAAVVCNFIDVTETTEPESLVPVSTVGYSQVFDAVPDIICAAHLNGMIRMANPAMCYLLEYTCEELLTFSIFDLIHPDDVAQSKERMRLFATESGLSLYFENRYITRTGKIRWLAWTASNGNQTELVFGAAKNMTEKRELDTLLDRSSALARIGAWEVDMTSGKVYWSAITRAIYEVDDSLKPDLMSCISACKDEEERQTLSERLNGMIIEGGQMDVEMLIVTARGNEKWVRLIGDAEVANGQCTRIYGSLQDVDDRKRAEIAASYVIEERDRKFSEITWLQSHVIRAPLCRVMGLVDILRTTGIREGESDEILEYLIASANELDEVIRSITLLASGSETEDTIAE